jgi:hypothetical protein
MLCSEAFFFLDASVMRMNFHPGITCRCMLARLGSQSLSKFRVNDGTW